MPRQSPRPLRTLTPCLAALAVPLLAGCGDEVLQKKLLCEVVDDAYATDQLSAYEILYPSLDGIKGDL